MNILELKEIIFTSLDDIICNRANFKIKSDGSYVSEGDLLVQSIVRNWIDSHLPDHVFISEEEEITSNNWDVNGSYVVLDPIDGTENFISGLKEWGIGLSIFTMGSHEQSFILLPELNDYQITGMPFKRYNSRIIGLSSALSFGEMLNLNFKEGVEYRIIGCAMYNLLMAARGSYMIFENVKGVNCWDILPGLNLAREAGCQTWVNDEPYNGQILFPTQKYRVKIQK